MWNARSVNNKRAEVEFLLHERDLDVLCISELWLAKDVVFELYGYLTYRRDRQGGGGGGSVNLVRDSLSVLPLSVDGPWCSRLDVAAVRLSTSLGSLAVMSVYAPPDSGVDSGLWSSLIGCAYAGKAMRAIGVLRALSRVSWGVSLSLLLLVYRGLVRAYLEWGSPHFAGACRTALSILDRAQYEALHVALGCMRSTPIAVLLSESNEPLLGLRRSLLGGRFILRNASRRDGPLIPKLRLLSERSRFRRFRIRPVTCGLLLAYDGVRGLMDMCFRTIRPLYFDYRWTELTIPVPLDFETGREVRVAMEPALEFASLVDARYPDSVSVFTDASRDDSSEGVGVGFCIPSLGYRFGIRLTGFTSVLSAELYSTFCALKYIFRLSLSSAAVFSDSLYALYHLRDGFFSTRVSPYVFKILHLLSLIRVRDCVVSFAWILSHSGISGNEQADCVARTASQLPFTVHCGVPLADLCSGSGLQVLVLLPVALRTLIFRPQ